MIERSPYIARFSLKRIALFFLVSAASFPWVAETAVARVTHESVVGEGYSKTSVNTAIFRASSLATWGEIQYVCYYDPDGYLTLGRRALGSDDWEIRRSDYKGNVKDAHNVISMGIDGDGFIHVAFDHHGNPLKYCRTLEPGGLELGPLAPMTGELEADVTYPEFHTLPDGDLLFLYRSGESGNGNLVVKWYSPDDGIWSCLHENLIDGQGKRNAYWQTHVGEDGTIHVSWVWRETWDVETNHDLCYARSRDGGLSWERSDGKEYDLPIRMETAERIWKIPQGRELINQTSMTADPEGHPMIATYWRDADSKVPQYRLVRHDGRRWRMETVGERTSPFSLSGGGTKMIPICRPRMVCDGKTIRYIFRDTERGGKVSMAVKDVKETEWKITDLTDYSVDAWEPSIDESLWNASRQLHIFVQETSQGDGERAVERESTPIRVLEVCD